jgi:competence protein ComEC
MVGYALMPLGLEGLALVPMGWGISAVLWIADTVAAWPGAAHTLPAMPTFGIVLVGVGGLWLCLWRARWRVWGAAAVVAGLMTTGMAVPPDVLISDDGRYMAVRATDGGLMATSSRSNYTVDSWLRHDGLDAALPWPKPGEVSADGRMRCDRLGCIANVNGVEIALVQDERAFAEDCGRAQIVIAAVPAFNPCLADVVVDRFDVWWRGAHAVWVTPDGIRVRSVSDARGDRPWVLPRHRSRN